MLLKILLSFLLSFFHHNTTNWHTTADNKLTSYIAKKYCADFKDSLILYPTSKSYCTKHISATINDCLKDHPVFKGSPLAYLFTVSDATTEKRLGTLYRCVDTRFSKPFISTNHKQNLNYNTLKHNAKHGDKGLAEYGLHMLYAYKFWGFKPNDKKAFYWLQRSYESGYTPARNDLASYYAKGKGTKQNYPKAHQLYLESANAGDQYAMYNIGLGYFKGQEGYPVDYTKAIQWYKKAAKSHKVPCATHDLGFIYREDKSHYKDLKKAKAMFAQTFDDGIQTGMVDIEMIDHHLVHKEEIRTDYIMYMMHPGKGYKRETSLAIEKQLAKICYS